MNGFSPAWHSVHRSAVSSVPPPNLSKGTTSPRCGKNFTPFFRLSQKQVFELCLPRQMTPRSWAAPLPS